MRYVPLLKELELAIDVAVVRVVGEVAEVVVTDRALLVIVRWRVSGHRRGSGEDQGGDCHGRVRADAAQGMLDGSSR